MRISRSRIAAPKRSSKKRGIECLAEKCGCLVSGLVGHPRFTNPRSEQGGHVERRFIQGIAHTGVEKVSESELGYAWSMTFARSLDNMSGRLSMYDLNNAVVQYLLLPEEEEIINNDAAGRMSEIFFEEAFPKGIDLENECLSLMAIHSGPGRHHIHLLLSRINIKTNKIIRENGGWWKVFLSRVAARIEAEFGMKEDPVRRLVYRDGQFVERRFPFDSEKMYLQRQSRLFEIETGQPSEERLFKRTAKNVGARVASGEIASWPALFAALEKIGMRYSVGVNGGGNLVFGNIRLGTAACDKRLNRNSLEKKFGACPDHFRRVDV
ncbi:MAG: relaxase/mobilization nuclease domain-containing protein [Desulfovibrio sp.]|jgi:hypothetical protein|nr:relaxase/mobilization nuclease domain-containing protein [Desulfovibrio sp.]